MVVRHFFRHYISPTPAMNHIKINNLCVIQINLRIRTSGKWSNPGHFLKSQGKFLLSFPYTLFYIFLTTKIINETLKSVLGRSIYH